MKRNKEIKISLTEEEMNKIEEIAKKIGITKSHLARNIVLVGLEEAEFYQNIGLFDLIKSVKKLRKKAIELSKK
jgi:predicted DNA-binding protein